MSLMCTFGGMAVKEMNVVHVSDVMDGLQVCRDTMIMWHNYKTMTMSVVSCYLPPSPSVKLRAAWTSWHHRYSFSETRYAVLHFPQRHHSLVLTSLSERCLRLTHSGLFDFVRTGTCGSTGYRYIVGRMGRTAATLFFRFNRSLWLESEAIRLRKRATVCVTKNGRFFVGLHLWLHYACAHYCIPRMREVWL